MDLRLKGKRALVCAASKGLGLAAARSLAAEGVELFLVARTEADLESAAESIQSEFNVPVKYLATDLSKSDSVQSLLQHLATNFGGVDILVNNVGGPKPSSAAETELGAWRQGFERVFLSAVLLSQGTVPGMRKRGFGRIVTITSTSVVEPIDQLVVSTTMRAAVTTFSKTLAKEVAADGITVNTVMPGVIHTGRIEDLRRQTAARLGTTVDVEMEKTKKSIPMQRLGKPEELGDLVAFLASPRSAYTTAMNFAVDGGARKGW